MKPTTTEHGHWSEKSEQPTKPESNGQLIFDNPFPTEVPVIIGTEQFILREADETASCKYHNAIYRSSTLVGEGEDRKLVPGDGFADVEPILVAACLYRTTKEGQRGPLVPYEEIMTWRADIVSKLFDKAKAISHIGTPGEKEKAKNLPGATVGISA